MTQAPIAYIMPIYGGFDYARRCLLSLFKYTPDGVAIVIDDASPDFDDSFLDEPRQRGSVIFERFDENRGLTAAWNRGMTLARELDPRYIIAGNHDVLFTEGWSRGLIQLLEGGVDLAGPLSNAPGRTAAGLQDVRHYVRNYRVTDDPAINNELARALWRSYAGQAVLTPINGFFMMARARAWFDHAHDARHVFRPVNPTHVDGRVNATPLMTGNEDELQQRWRHSGLRTAAAPSSFIFHYRSVARGMEYADTGWARMNDPAKEV